MALRDSFARIKKMLGQTESELVTGYTVRRYEQLETFPEMIKQEWRPAVCERRLTDRQTDRLKENYSIDMMRRGEEYMWI